MISKYEKIILVTGATGKQGGAVARHLIKNGWQVRAVTRDPAKMSARALVDMGVEVVAGNLNDPQSLERAIGGAYGVFSVLANEEGIEAEIRQGKLLADIAKEHNISHFVYSSVAGADKNTGIPFFDSKWQIEEHVKASGLLTTICRPAFFMENFLAPQMRSSIAGGVLSLPMKPEKSLQMVAVDDIGAFTAIVFEEPEKYISKVIALAGDEITMPRAAELLGRVIRREVKFNEMPIEQMESMNPGYAKMFRWFNDYGFNIDISKLRSTYPELKAFEQWLHFVNYQQYAATTAFAGH